MQIKGIDIDIALANVAGDEDLLKSILEIFIEEEKEMIPKLYESFPSNIELFTVQIHSVKSSCKNIGAMELADKALKLEMAGKESNFEYIDANLRDYISDITEMITEISLNI